MQRLLAGVVVAAVVSASAAAEKGGKAVSDALNFTMKGIDGKDVNLADYRGKVVLFVNVASQCGYTPQYKGLQSLHEKYKDRGLVVVGVPANEFGAQEPGSNAEIAEFCKSNYHVTFPMLGKVVVKGEGITPLYKYLTENASPAGAVGWNFEKFLVGKDGRVAGRFKSGVAPESKQLADAVEAELAK